MKLINLLGLFAGGLDFVSFCFCFVGGGFVLITEFVVVDVVVVVLVFCFCDTGVSLSLLFSGLNILFFLISFFLFESLFCFDVLSFVLLILPLVLPLVLLFLCTNFDVNAFLCCADDGCVLPVGFCALITGATVAVAFGFVGGFFLLIGFCFICDSSDSDV